MFEIVFGIHAIPLGRTLLDTRFFVFEQFKKAIARRRFRVALEKEDWIGELLILLAAMIAIA